MRQGVEASPDGESRLDCSSIAPIAAVFSNSIAASISRTTLRAIFGA
jgi:hypothetical protein